MKTLKFSYYISLAICIIQLLAHLCAPFGGPLTIWDMMTHGLFEVTTKATAGDRVIFLNHPPYSLNPATKNLQLLNSILAVIYFTSITLCCITPIFYKLSLKTKYKIGIISCGITLFICTIGAILWKYLTKTYLGI